MNPSQSPSWMQLGLFVLSLAMFLCSIALWALGPSRALQALAPFFGAFLALLALQVAEWRVQQVRVRMALALVMMGLSIGVLALAEGLFGVGTAKWLPQEHLQRFFLTMWWMLPSILLSAFLLRFVIEPLERRFQRRIPALVKYMLTTFVLTMGGFGAMAFVFGYNMGGVVATSGFVMALAGFSIRAHVGNIISGIALNIERPFLPGDWVTIDGIVAKVLDISWRSTKLQTFQNATLLIPNDKVARANILNWDRQEPSFGEGYWIFQTLHFHPHHDPDKLTELLYEGLKQAKAVDGREALAMQWVKCVEVDEYGLKFAVAFDCTNRLLKNSQEHEVLLSIHRCLREAGISIATGLLRVNQSPDQSARMEQYWPGGAG